jgi:hypothetical protein
MFDLHADFYYRVASVIRGWDFLGPLLLAKRHPIALLLLRLKICLLFAEDGLLR